MATTELQDFYTEYGKALDDRDAALFIGAGISKGAGLKSWSELLESVATDLGLQIDKETDLISLAQYHFNKHRVRSRLNQLLRDEFDRPMPLSDDLRLIARLPVDTIWTTNYDHMLEQAYEAEGKRYDTKVMAEDLSVSMRGRDVTIYKMHGDVNRPDTAVLIKDDYEVFARDRELFSTVLRGDLVNKTFLFLGYSLSDPNVDYILAHIRILLGNSPRPHYWIVRRPIPPRDHTDRAEYEYAKRKLDLRIDDLKRYGIEALLIDSFDEVTEILTQLNRRAHRNNVFISGSAAQFAPLDKDRVEQLVYQLSRDLIRSGQNLVSGFGLGIGGVVALGALEHIYRNNLSLTRLSLFPFPQRECDDGAKEKFYSQYRTSMLSNSGFAIFISGNRKDPSANIIIDAPGVMEEFDIACHLGKVPIPFGASGWAAWSIWQKVGTQPNTYYGTKNVSGALKILGESGRTDDEYVDAIFKMIDELGR